MVIKRHIISHALIWIILTISACDGSSNSDASQYCANPAPLGGQFDQSAPGYIVYLDESVNIVEEVNRLIANYSLQVNVIYDSLNGFFAEMNDDTRERLRCETSVKSIHYNGTLTTM